MRPLSPGVFMWRGWRWRMSGFLSSYREPWPRRLRPPGRPGPRWSLLRGNTRPAELSDRQLRLLWTAPPPCRYSFVFILPTSKQIAPTIKNFCKYFAIRFSWDICKPWTVFLRRTTRPWSSRCRLTSSTRAWPTWRPRPPWCLLSHFPPQPLHQEVSSAQPSPRPLMSRWDNN